MGFDMSEGNYIPGRAFEQSLANMTHDIASGDAIRHLVNKGYTVSQIMKHLDFPTPRERVEKTITRYLRDTGAILDNLPEGAKELLDKSSILQAENIYVSCPFAAKFHYDREKLKGEFFDLLSYDEADYLSGILWEHNPMYHRLSLKMRGICNKLEESGKFEFRYFRID